MVERPCLLQTFDKLLQAPVIACGVVPEAGMSGSQHPNPRAANAIHLLINDSRFDNRIIGAMGNYGQRIEDPQLNVTEKASGHGRGLMKRLVASNFWVQVSPEINSR
jgi:hypothetical protein